MPDYATAAADLKSRLNAKAQRSNDLDAFYEGVRSGLFAEIEKANSALTFENAPLIEFTGGWPTGNSIELLLAGATCLVSMTPMDPAAPKPPTLAATIHAERGEKPVTFLLIEDERPLKAQRVSLAPQSEPKLDPAEVAAAIVVELMAGTP